MEQQVKNPQKTCQRGAALQITNNPGPRRKTNQIKGMLQNNKGVAQKALPPTTLAQKTDETTKTQDKQAKKQRFQAKKYKQTSIAVTKQINSESTQLLWQEKTAKEATVKKLIAQFGFVSDPTLSRRHNASTTLAKNTNLVLLLKTIQHGLPRLHEMTQTTKKLTITPWTGLKIHPDTKSNKLLEPTKTIII